MSLERSITEHRRGTIDARRGTVDPRSSRISSISQHQDSGKRYSQTVNPIDNTTVMLADGDYWLMFRPTSPRRLAWDILMMFLLIYVAIVAPYRIGFGADASGNWKTWETVLDMLFILDLFVNFRTGYFFEEEEVMEQNRVAKHYLKTWFLLDFLSSIPFDLMEAGLKDTSYAKLMKSGKFVKVFRMLRITKMVRFMKGSVIAEQFDDWVNMAASRHTMRMCKLLIGTMFASHLNCCLWAGIGNAGDEDTGSWILFYDAYLSHEDGFDINDLGSKYLAAMYWSIQTMTTVGYGDIVPQNDSERAYSIFSMILGGGYYGFIVATMASLVSNLDANAKSYYEKMDNVTSYMKKRKFPKNDSERAYSIFSMILGGGYYGFIVATMASLVSNLDANAKSYYEKMDNVTSYMKKRKFPKVLFRKMRKYYKHYFEQRTALNETEILDDLSSQLRTEVALFLIHDIVYNIDLFHDLTPEMLAKLLTVLKPLQIGSGEVLSVAGEIGREMYIVISGELKMTKPGGDPNGTILNPGEYFGELCALDINPINLSTTKAASPCDLYSLSRDDVFNTFRDMPEVLGHMKDVALETFVIEHKLDAEAKEEDQVLTDFLKNQTAEAVHHKTSNTKVDTRKKAKVKMTIPGREGEEGSGGGRDQRGTLTSKIMGKAALDLDIDEELPVRVSGDVERRMEALENKLDKVLTALAGGGLANQNQNGGQRMSNASQMRQMALKEEHDLKLEKKILKRVGSFTDKNGSSSTLQDEIGREAQAAVQHRRQSMATDQNRAGSGSPSKLSPSKSNSGSSLGRLEEDGGDGD
ncbi:hypothetical protein TL16_g01078 [Triparma laevis f. inornata]|uniref:Cyclic nucleotide-binding domain-containing protein n=1 Tax=Triparma laevis f. inornata TaxID=1714386 RepID=A0A9W6ZKN6_9STRA|nr:hypothetical protein TL16_g01078 [Triparma laevis f. inornata]